MTVVDARITAVTVLALGLTACATADARTDAGVTDGTVNVVLDEWSLGFEQAQASQGELAFQVRNAGEQQHNLTVEEAGGGEQYYQTALLNPGEATQFSLDLADDSYDLYCSVPGHREAGLEATLTVGAAQPAEPAEEEEGGGYY